MVLFYGGCVLDALGTGYGLDSYMTRAQPAPLQASYVIVSLFVLVHSLAFALAYYTETSHPAWPTDLSLSDSHIVIPSLVFALWGLSDAMINTFLNWLIGALFTQGDEKARAIGMWKLVNSVAHIYGYYFNIDRMSASMQLVANMLFFYVGCALMLPVLLRHFGPYGAVKRRTRSM